ncbi:uncharacterized protein EV154DRAFT_70213 [Mucor mucedo]|uniref:uncharacterized protein n=1 Tax=Mucor mucedo TaxID=29922 RepID=UPI0022210281|nr:uncharacterized protein EV154DRAFT_70213 [Mucor mucedo]KAI7894707.1 hypothetical protein EV154DRAFT_70213 [Mucor mucedo]
MTHKQSLIFFFIFSLSVYSLFKKKTFFFCPFFPCKRDRIDRKTITLFIYSLLIIFNLPFLNHRQNFFPLFPS